MTQTRDEIRTTLRRINPDMDAANFALWLDACMAEQVKEEGTAMPNARDERPIIAPIIHLNGDRKDSLVTRLETAYDAVRAAEKALQACWPNARNYYPVPGLYPQAEAQHAARMDHLKAVAQSLCDEAEAIG